MIKPHFTLANKSTSNFGIILALVVLFVVIYSPHASATSGIETNTYQLADYHAEYYPWFLDDNQNPTWAPDGGVKDFNLPQYNQGYGGGAIDVEYKVFLENSKGSRIYDGTDVRVGEVIEIVAADPNPTRMWSWIHSMESTGGSASYSFTAKPAATTVAAGSASPILNTTGASVGIVDDLTSISRSQIAQSRFQYRGGWNGEDFYLAMFLANPTVSHTVSGSATVTQLSDTTYRVDSPGSLAVSSVYAATQAEEYYAMEEVEIDRIISIYDAIGYGTNDMHQLMYDRLQDLKSKAVDGLAVEKINTTNGQTLNIGSVTLESTVNVLPASPATVPVPTVSVMTTEPIYPGDLVEFELTSPTVTDLILHKADWNNDLTIDEIMGGWYWTAASGTIQATGLDTVVTSRIWSTPGIKTVNFQSFVNGTFSAWTPVEVNVVEKPPVTTSLELQANGGTWSSSDRNISTSDTLAIRWDSQYADYCTGTHFNTNGNASSASVGESVAPPAPGMSLTYRVECTDGITTDSSEVTIAMPVPPSLYAYLQPGVRSNEFDYTTGNYDEYTVNFAVGNNAAVNETTAIPYTVSLDIGATGVYDRTVTGTFSGGIEANSTVSRSATFNDIPFGLMGIRINFSYPTLGTIEGVVTIPSPEPEASLDVTPLIIRSGTQALIEWDVGAEFPMNCTIRGGTLLDTFDPSIVGATGSTTTPTLDSAMRYQLRCVEPITTTEFNEEFKIEVIGLPLSI